VGQRGRGISAATNRGTTMPSKTFASVSSEKQGLVGREKGWKGSKDRTGLPREATPLLGVCKNRWRRGGGSAREKKKY